MDSLSISLLCLFSLLFTVNDASCDTDNGWDELPNYDEHHDRIQYIACVEVEWDYCPIGAFGTEITSADGPGTWCYQDQGLIGSTYKKALYREFTNSCFDEEMPRTPEQEHLGAVGPNVRLLTEENIKVFYKNMCSMDNSMHFHGLKYDKLSEGAVYPDGDESGDRIEPGEQWIYYLHSRDTNIDEGVSSKMWIYHSHVDEPMEVMSGLIGAVIVTKKGMERGPNELGHDLMPCDIHREFTNFWIMYDENASWYIEWNRDNYAPDAELEDEAFEEGNKMHSINGFLYGGIAPFLVMNKCENVRWYSSSIGDEVDGPHSPHWHANLVVNTVGENLDTLNLIPGVTMTTTMHTDAEGVWLYHCHVHDHIYGGMISVYTVNGDEGECDTSKTSTKYMCGIGGDGDDVDDVDDDDDDDDDDSDSSSDEASIMFAEKVYDDIINDNDGNNQLVLSFSSSMFMGVMLEQIMFGVCLLMIVAMCYRYKVQS